jgi:hypothetical protein
MAKETGSPSKSRRRGRALTQAARRRRALLVVAIAAINIAIVAAVVALVFFVLGGGTSDDEAIEELGRRSIETLPQAVYPSLYDDFTGGFRQRCPRDEFEQAGEEAASQLGDDLPFLRFKRLEDVFIQGDNARAVIVGQVAAQPEYKVQAAFQKEDGTWKIAPAANTQGCETFQSIQ